MKAPAGGRVVLVGAGPGDPDLITVRGLRRLREADTVLYDRLVHPALLAEVAPDCDALYVGKEPGRPALEQVEIERLMIERARHGELVVRLKGGDPFVFGRGAEEALACATAGVPCEVVPGISSALAGPAVAGIPVTHRGVAASFAVVTGHRTASAAGDAVPPDWRALRAVDTLVILMGVEHLETITGELLRAGWDAQTSAAVIERATLPAERVIEAPLGALAARARAAHVRAPAVIVVGEVVALRAEIARSEPLFTDAALLDPQLERNLDDLTLFAEGPPWRGLPREVSAQVFAEVFAEVERQAGGQALPRHAAPSPGRGEEDR